jgi:hypothetical protein
MQIFFIMVSLSFVTVGFAETVNLKWNSPTSGGAASGYNLYYGESDDISTMTKISGITGTSYSLEGLDLHKTYYFYLKAFNSMGEGPASEVKASNVSLRVVN